MSKPKEWYETYFDGLYGRAFPSSDAEARVIAEARTVKRVLRLRKGQRVLDCPCGLGRLTFQLAKMGLAMTGVDLTASFVRKAKRRAKKQGADIRFLRCDMRELPFDGEFDAVINWFNSFGYFDDADNLAAAKAAFAALKPGGKFLIEVMNRSWVLLHFRQYSDGVVGGVRIVQRHKWHPDSGRLSTKRTFSKGKKAENHRISIRIYNGAEMRSLLRSAGFRDIRLFGHPPLGRFTRHSRRMIAIGRRPVK